MTEHPPGPTSDPRSLLTGDEDDAPYGVMSADDHAHAGSAASDEVNQRLNELEMKVAYQDETIASLNHVVTELHAQVSALDDDKRRIEEALLRLATKAPARNVIGDNAALDPVPSSG